MRILNDKHQQKHILTLGFRPFSSFTTTSSAALLLASRALFARGCCCCRDDDDDDDDDDEEDICSETIGFLTLCQM